MAVINEMAMQGRERRRHERVDDDIVVFWRAVKPEEIPAESDQTEPPSNEFSLSSQIKLLSLESTELLKRIGRSNPLLAEYLTVLERKVNALANALVVKENFANYQTTRHVNLSASGLAFLTDKEYPLGTLLELKMVLSPTMANINAYGRIIYCIHYEDDKPLSHRIGVGFIRLRDYDREMLTGRISRRDAQIRKTLDIA